MSVLFLLLGSVAMLGPAHFAVPSAVLCLFVPLVYVASILDERHIPKDRSQRMPTQTFFHLGD
jgi:hypothetical protein